MNRIVLLIAALGVVTALSASTIAQPLQEPQIGALNDQCRQGNLAACVHFGVFIGSISPEGRAELTQRHPEWFWWADR